jgi:hypothetical protein
MSGEAAMAGQTTYTVEVAEGAWYAFKEVPPELRARIQALLEKLAAEVPGRPTQGGSVLTKHLQDGHGYSLLITVDHAGGRVTLLEVTRVQ